MTITARFRWLWRELTKPRSLSGRVHHRRERKGIAILVVISSLMIITVLVTELVYSARVRYMVALHERDRVQAYWLARSGVNMHQLILLANKEISNNPQVKQGLEMLGMGGTFEFWNFPFVQSMNTGLLRMLLTGGGDIDSVDGDVVEEFKQTGRFAAEEGEEVRSSIFDDRDFLAFEGDFSSEISDHESKVNINVFATENVTTAQESPTGQFIFALMSKEEDLTWFRQRGIDPWEMIGNLKDWVDADTIRSGGRGGYEDSLYNTLDPPYLTKNAPFDSMDEIRLVAGWEGELCDRYCDKLSIYGNSEGKINMNTMDDSFILAIVNSCIEGGTPLRPQQIIEGMQNLQNSWLLGRPTYDEPAQLVKDLVNVAGFPVNQDCATQKLTTKSQVFTVASTGLVGTSEVTIEAVFDFSGNTREGELKYWRVR
jgi:general secretion pathway protein K